MFFKNLAIYQLPPNYFVDRFTLSAALAKLPARHPAAEEEATYGFTFPTAHTFERVVETPNHALVICAEKVEKIIPAAAVKDLLAKEISACEAKENRKLSKKERQILKDEIIFSILPQALTKSSQTYAYIDPIYNFLVVDSSSAKKAEDLLSHLRRALGSLPVVPLNSEVYAESLFTNWAKFPETVPDQFNLEQEFELKGFEKGTIRGKDQDPTADEIIGHIDTGMQITKLGLTFNDEMTFVLTDVLQVKKLKFLYIVHERIADTDTENQTQYFLASMAIQIEAIRKLLTALDYELTFKKREEEPYEIAKAEAPAETLEEDEEEEEDLA